MSINKTAGKYNDIIVDYLKKIADLYKWSDTYDISSCKVNLDTNNNKYGYHFNVTTIIKNSYHMNFKLCNHKFTKSIIDKLHKGFLHTPYKIININISINYIYGVNLITNRHPVSTNSNCIQIDYDIIPPTNEDYYCIEDLPTEILYNEILSNLDYKDMLSFSLSSKNNNRFCLDNKESDIYWINKLNKTLNIKYKTNKSKYQLLYELFTDNTQYINITNIDPNILKMAHSLYDKYTIPNTIYDNSRKYGKYKFMIDVPKLLEEYINRFKDYYIENTEYVLKNGVLDIDIMRVLGDDIIYYLDVDNSDYEDTIVVGELVIDYLYNIKFIDERYKV